MVPQRWSLALVGLAGRFTPLAGLWVAVVRKRVAGTPSLSPQWPAKRASRKCRTVAEFAELTTLALPWLLHA